MRRDLTTYLCGAHPRSIFWAVSVLWLLPSLNGKRRNWPTLKRKTYRWTMQRECSCRSHVRCSAWAKFKHREFPLELQRLVETFGFPVRNDSTFGLLMRNDSRLYFRKPRSKNKAHWYEDHVVKRWSRTTECFKNAHKPLNTSGPEVNVFIGFQTQCLCTIIDIGHWSIKMVNLMELILLHSDAHFQTFLIKRPWIS